MIIAVQNIPKTSKKYKKSEGQKKLQNFQNQLLSLIIRYFLGMAGDCLLHFDSFSLPLMKNAMNTTDRCNECIDELQGERERAGMIDGQKTII